MSRLLLIQSYKGNKTYKQMIDSIILIVKTIIFEIYGLTQHNPTNAIAVNLS